MVSLIYLNVLPSFRHAGGKRAVSDFFVWKIYRLRSDKGKKKSGKKVNEVLKKKREAMKDGKNLGLVD